MKKQILMILVIVFLTTMSLFSINVNDLEGRNVSISYNGQSYPFKVVSDQSNDIYIYNGTEFGKCLDNVVKMFEFSEGVRNTEMEQTIGEGSVVYEYIHYKSGYKTYIIVGLSKEDNKYMLMVFLPAGCKL